MKAEAEMLAVIDRLVKQHREVVVVKLVDDALTGADGEVIDGSSNVDQATITGEIGKRKSFRHV